MALILGLESSCDDTAVALVTSDRRILAQAVVSQNDAHRPFGGVVPEIAARAHVQILPDLVRGLLAEAGIEIANVDAIAATAGPGLIGGVMVALMTGKGLALAAGKPLIAVNHLEGHALSPRLIDPDLDFPYLLLLVSGGHCQILEVLGVGDYRRLATTIDNSDPTLVFARGTRQRLAVLLATPAWLRSQLSATLTSLSSGFVEVALVDDKGGRILGGRDPQPGTARIERAVPALGWTIAVTSAVPPEVRDQQTARRRLLFASALLAIGLVLLASYAVGRSIARELAVARLQADFVAAVSHEFRTPLSSLRQLTELLSDGRVSDDARRTVYYQRLQRETERLQRLVEGLLDFNRIEAGAHEFRFDTFDAAEFLRDLARDFTEEAESRAHRLNCRIPPARVIVRADREALGRAVWNLLDNAVKYSPDGTTVSLTLAETDGRVRIVVQDDGLGIPSDQQSRIFQKFVRAPGHSGIRGRGWV